VGRVIHRALALAAAGMAPRRRAKHFFPAARGTKAAAKAPRALKRDPLDDPDKAELGAAETEVNMLGASP